MTPSPTLSISETFVSLQGEGRLTGVPSWFVRVAGCNLRCTWCDTPYASWAPEGMTRTVDDLLAEAESSGVRHAVLTGGEPMIFDPIEALAQGLRERDIHVTIETAGTRHRPPDRLPCDLLSLSPKLANSTPSPDDPRDPTGAWAARHEARRLPIATIQSLLDDYRTHQLKFVVAHADDLPEIDALMQQLTGWAPEHVMLMPEGTTVPAPESIGWVVDACRERGWRYCHRLHVELFGDTRGT